jgi:AcrR family transcriptional regulator
MRSLAAEIGLSPMAAYKHFENQRELQLELWSSCMMTLTEETVHALQTVSEPGDAFIMQCTVFVQWATTHPYRFELVFNHPFIREVRKEQATYNVRYGLWELGQKNIRGAQESGSFRSDHAPTVLAMFAHSVMQGLAYNLVSDRVRMTSKLEQDEAIRTTMAFLRESLSGRIALPIA